MDEYARRVLSALEVSGVLMQHDRVLPAATAAVAGGPVAGSWWSHPMAHEIFGALNDLDDDGLVLRVRLVAGKQTLVAPALWPALVAVGAERAGWQLDGAEPSALALLDAVEASSTPILLDGDTRVAGRWLEDRLLAHAVEVHLPTGRHGKALQSWAHLAVERDIATLPDPGEGRASFAAAISTWGDPARLLPWPVS
ncbi:MAG TPA: hypothetical protein VF228_16235 [Iamia sp.]